MRAIIADAAASALVDCCAATALTSSAAMNEVAQLREENGCMICMAGAPRTIAFQCGHTLCGGCAAAIGTRCPWCKVPIKARIKLYM
jgi:hypothetical protein